MKKLSLLEKLWLLGPVVIWFSYQPLIRLAQDSTSYYELSIPLVYLLLLGIVGLASIWRGRARLSEQKSLWLAGAFLGYSLLSLAWTPNLLRGILTAGIIGLLYLVLLAGVVESRRLKVLTPLLVKVTIISAAVMSLFAFIQAFAGIWLNQGETLLCAGCVPEQFGFVRPNVFAIEPQFFGNLLLAPLLILAHLILLKKQPRYAAGIFWLMSASLFLTLSRGAIYAFIVALIVLIVVHRQRSKQIIKLVGLTATSLVFVLLFQGASAALSQKVETTFIGAVSASINQLSLGIIDIPVVSSADDRSNVPAPKSDGYIEESTNVRVNHTQLALGTWASDVPHMLFGVGLAGSGVAVHQMYPDRIGAREITQNQYTELLLEYGLAGAALFGLLIIGFCYETRRHKWVWAILLAYLVQWNFFSGYPNAVHVYLVLIVAFILLRGQLKPAKQY